MSSLVRDILQINPTDNQAGNIVSVDDLNTIVLSHRIVRFFDRTIGCDLVSHDRSAMFAAISNRTLWCILYDWL